VLALNILDTSMKEKKETNLELELHLVHFLLLISMVASTTGDSMNSSKVNMGNHPEGRNRSTKVVLQWPVDNGKVCLST
jgi:hypothetical protein